MFASSKTFKVCNRQICFLNAGHMYHTIKRKQMGAILHGNNKFATSDHSERVTQKNRTHIFLSEIHKFNSSSFVFSGYEVDSVHEILEP